MHVSVSEQRTVPWISRSASVLKSCIPLTTALAGCHDSNVTPLTVLCTLQSRNIATSQKQSRIGNGKQSSKTSK